MTLAIEQPWSRANRATIWTSPLVAGWSARLVAAYVLIMPLVAGIPRGKFAPLVRLSEITQIALTAAALGLAAVAYARSERWKIRLLAVDWWMIGLAFCGSILPVISLAARGEPVALGSFIDSFAMVKYLLLWILVRTSIKSIHDATTVLMAVVLSASVVALLAILEGLGIGPTGSITRSLIAGGEPDDGTASRAYTLLGSAISTGAVIALASSVAFGFAVTRRHIGYVVALGLMGLGALATGQATAVLGLAVALGVAAWQYRVVLRTLMIGIPAAFVGALIAMPIIERRLEDVGSRSLLPQSWQIRWANVSELYWPSVADGGWLLGVDPDTVVVPPDTWRSEVYLESGYVWTLWVGGLPLLICFVGFLWAAWRATNVYTTDPRHEVARVAAKGVIIFLVLFNIIDPHISLRGSADFSYVIIPVALAFLPMAVSDTRQRDLLGLVQADPFHASVAGARIQIGEIGGELLRPSGWPPVTPGNGVDRGIDLAIRYRGQVTGEARLFLARYGNQRHGALLHDIRAADAEAEAMVWRGLALCAASLRLDTLELAPNVYGFDRLTRRELNQLANEAERLELERSENTEMIRALLAHSGPGGSGKVPPGVRIEPNPGISRTRRFMDVAVSGAALVALAPLFLVVGRAVRRSSPGPVFFRQVRVGAGGRPFELLKFRTMDNTAGEDVHRRSIEDGLLAGAMTGKVENDARITRTGAFLRRHSIDELPQLINVLRGEMTLVGPRPSLLWETGLFSPVMRRRLQMTPGIAGLWQASGRGDLSTDEMLDLDLEYAEQASLRNDLRLLWRTAVAVFKKTGAR